MTHDLTAFDRRKVIKRNDGSTLSYSIPAGVTDEEMAAEIAKAQRAIALGYTTKCCPDGPLGGGLRTNVRWLRNHPRLGVLRLYLLVIPSRAVPRAIERAYFWLKCRWLDAYWFVRGRAAQERCIAKAGDVK